MKYELGSKSTGAPVSIESRVWYPSVSIKMAKMPTMKVGDAVVCDVEAVVCGVTKDPNTGEFSCELELHSISMEKSKSNMEKAGY